MKKILFISHFFPPTGGSGVQRSVKFVKNLPELGFQPTVISSYIDNKNKWTPSDTSLENDVPDFIKVHRLPDNSEFAVPNNFAENPSRTKGIFEIGSSIIAEEKISLIYVSLSPFGDLSPAIKLAEFFNLPLVADLRDPWALDEFQSQRSAYHRRREISRMRSQIARCTHVIMNTPEAANKTLRFFPEIEAKSITWITNGFDEDDFIKPLSNKELLPKNRYNIIHTGTFHSDYARRQESERYINYLLRKRVPGLDISGRTPIYLLKAICLLRDEQPHLFEKLNVVFAGIISQQDKDLIRNQGLEPIITATGYLSHDICIEYTRRAEMLFLPLHGLRKGERCSIVPGKTYEYLASEATILAATPPGDAKDFVRQRGRCFTCSPRDTNSIHQALVSSILNWSLKAELQPIDKEFISHFSREKLSIKLAEILSKAISRNKSNK
ncbi:hypothetical protein [Pelagicoccus sp. SDUM812002]|uniref:hypothetical protein n=1 Tax=Pelagicoccus sp. SDUM812002 TaxID=3041266 RepID=UPI00280D72D2|nr:hypothetical protein [Pelagicoccus sp. SDUM812002]MDQ8188057.1 hypothetical protein [Pelagicoccus sp. SDUM812002]